MHTHERAQSLMQSDVAARLGPGPSLCDSGLLTMLRRTTTLAVLLAILGFGQADAATIIPIDRPVVDTIGLVSAQGQQQLEHALTELRSQTRAHMAVLLVPTTGGTPIEDYAHQQAEAWGGGDAGVDQGVLLVIALNDRRMRLEVGYGLETVLTDRLSRQILDLARPAMRSGDHTAAIALIIKGVSNAVQGVALPRPAPVTIGRFNAQDPAVRAAMIRFLLVSLLTGTLFGIAGHVALSRTRRYRRRRKWLRWVVWGAGGALSAAVALFAPGGFSGAAVAGQCVMMPFGYMLARGPRGSKTGTGIIAALVLAIVALAHVIISGESAPLSPSMYALGPVILLFCSIIALAGLMGVLVILLLCAMLVAVVETRIRRIKYFDSAAIALCFWLQGATIKAFTGDPAASWSDGGGTSYSSSGHSSYSSSSSSSYSSSSSSSYSDTGSSWSGGGGSFGGGGASASW